MRVLRMLFKQSPEVGRSLLCCPICESELVHHKRVEIEQGVTRTTVSRESTTVEGTAPNWARGSAVTLHFWCEENHQFAYRFSFYKGSMMADLIATGEQITRERHELWRD